MNDQKDKIEWGLWLFLPRRKILKKQKEQKDDIKEAL